MAEIDEKRIQKATAALIKTLNKYNLTIPEMIKVHAKFGYTIGANMAGFKDKGPSSIKILEREYYSNPTVDIAMMLQCILMETWAEDYIQKPVLSTLATRLKEKEEDE